jgi:tetratricopeptide (TPR) repeat protein
MKDAMRAEELRQQGLAAIRANRLEESLPLFDEALVLAEDEDLRELIVVNKAGALISLEQSGPEVQKLPQIIMRRRSLRNVSLAAYNLQHKFQIEKDYKRASSYARIAYETAGESNEPEWQIAARLAMGNLAVYESRTSEAIEAYREVLEASPADTENGFRRAFVLQNLGYAKMMNEEIVEGITMIHSAIEMMRAFGADGYVAESYIDLCFGYLELENLDLALKYGAMGLELATEVRQVRNAHYLLGEVAYKLGDSEKAEMHFEELTKFYPDFPHLKNLLLAIDLRGLVNLKL